MIDNTNIQNLLKLSDDELKERLTKAAAAAGADPAKISSALSDMSTLRKLAGSLTPEAIDGLLNTFGKQNVQSIANILNTKE